MENTEQKSHSLFREVSRTFVEAVSMYALIADFFAFMAIITVRLSGWLPLWPSVAILFVSWMTIVGALIHALMKAQQTIHDLRSRLSQTPSRNAWRIMELREMFRDFS